MSSGQGKKSKTGIPVAKQTSRDGGGDGDVTTARSHSQSSNDGRREAPQQPQQSSHHPLAKAMAKKPKAKKHQTSETWADEKTESQSQKMNHYSQSEQKRRKEDMEKHLKEVEAELVSMSDLLDKREKLLKEAEEEAQRKTGELEQKLLDKDGLLIENGIDPVTGEKIVVGEEGQKKVESTKKFSKKRIQEMREKLKQMNLKTESYLSDIENTMQYLGSLETASERAGPMSEETQKMFGEISNEEEFIAQVYKENKQPEASKKNANVTSRLAPSGKEAAGSGDEEEEEDEENDDKKDFESKEEWSKFFLTHVDEEAENKQGDGDR